MAEKEKINALFARNLRALMNDSTVRKGKTTQRELASFLGITPQAVSTYCNEGAMPDYSLLLKIAAFFGESTDYLLTGVRPENKEAHELLGLSDEAIKLLKSIHNDKELEEKLLPLVDDILSKSEFYNRLLSAYHRLVFEYEESKQKRRIMSERISEKINQKRKKYSVSELERNGVIIHRGAVIDSKGFFDDEILSDNEIFPVSDYSVEHACDTMDVFFRGFFGRYKDAMQFCDCVREITPLYLEMMQGDKG